MRTLPNRLRCYSLNIVEPTVKSGFRAATVHASDICLFSSLIGYLADVSKRLEDPGIRILERRDLRGELDFAAHIMLILKLNQLVRRNCCASICAKNYGRFGSATERHCAKSSQG